MSFWEALGAAGAIGSAVVGAASLFKDNDEPAGSAELRAGAGRAKEISDILSSPNDPRFLQMVDQEEGRIRGDFAEAMKNLRVSNQRAMARGGAPMLNPERRDEAIAQASARGLEEARSRARDNARAYLTAAAQANQMSMGGFAQSASIDGTMDALGRMNRSNALQTIFGGVNALAQPAARTQPGQQTVGGKLFGSLFGSGSGSGTPMLNGGQSTSAPLIHNANWRSGNYAMGGTG
jgi:hypothetical protein